jgi:biopolymer transport protein ExbD
MAFGPTGAGKKGKLGKSASSAKKHMDFPGIESVLVPLIDTFIVLLVFLFQNFSSQGDIMSVSPDLSLPVSATKTPAKPSVIVAVSNKSILVEGKVVADSKEVIKSDKLIIDGLLAEMLRLQKIKKAIADADPSREFLGEVTIQADKLIQFELLMRVMYTCGQAEFGNIALAVLKKG